MVTRPLEITSLTKVFDTPTGPHVAVKDFSVLIHPGDSNAAGIADLYEKYATAK